VSLPVGLQVVRTPQWDLEFGPHYGGSREAGLIQQALGTGDLKRAARLLKVAGPYRVARTWGDLKAEAVDGRELAVRLVEAGQPRPGRRPGEALVEELDSPNDRARARIVLPDGPPGLLYRLELSCTLVDNTEPGHEATKDHTVWSHGVKVTGNEGPRALLEALAPSLTAASNEPGAAGAQARQAVTAATRLRDKEIVTVRDLRSFVETAALVRRVPRR
jgi:hypothetical protein